VLKDGLVTLNVVGTELPVGPFFCFGQRPLLGSFPDIQSGSRSERRSRTSPLQFIPEMLKEYFRSVPSQFGKELLPTCGDGGEIPSVLCGRANIRHSNRGHGDRRPL
jgi:hypothetical protein